MSISGRLRDHASAVCVHVLVRAAAAAAACIPPSSGPYLSSINLSIPQDRLAQVEKLMSLFFA